MNERLQHFWSHLNNPAKGFRSKTFPTSLTGVPRGEGFKALKRHAICNIRDGGVCVNIREVVLVLKAFYHSLMSFKI
jgi:hypothetical protein